MAKSLQDWLQERIAFYSSKATQFMEVTLKDGTVEKVPLLTEEEAAAVQSEYQAKFSTQFTLIS
jgi:hypothetical protein